MELASRNPSWPAIDRSHSTGRTYGCKRSDLTKKLLCHGGRPHMGPGLRRDDGRECGVIWAAAGMTTGDWRC
ncbi:hypothetical protein DXU07_35705 [Bradyrhizobium elkanii]